MRKGEEGGEETQVRVSVHKSMWGGRTGRVLRGSGADAEMGLVGRNDPGI